MTTVLYWITIILNGVIVPLTAFKFCVWDPYRSKEGRDRGEKNPE